MTGKKKSKKWKISHKIKDKTEEEEIEEEANLTIEKIVAMEEDMIIIEIEIEVDLITIEEEDLIIEVQIEEEDNKIEEIEKINYRKPIGFKKEKSFTLFTTFFYS